MSSIKRASLVATLALAALALTAGSASADIVDWNGGEPGGAVYDGPVAGVNSGDDPTLETDTVTITCSSASTSGTMDGNTPATAVLDFSWSGCNVLGQPLTTCNVAAIENVDVNIDEGAAPDATIVNDVDLTGNPSTSRGETLIQCLFDTFDCTASSDPTDGSGLTDGSGSGSEVTAEVLSGADPVVNIDDTVVVQGAGCPEVGQWVAEYTITTPAGGLRSNAAD